MANQEDIQKITLVDENGDEALYEVLFTFHSEEYGKDYILLVPEGVEDDEEVDIQAYIFNPDENGDATEEDLIQIEDDKEWDMVEEVLNTFLEDDSNFEWAWRNAMAFFLLQKFNNLMAYRVINYYVEEWASSLIAQILDDITALSTH